MTQQQKLPTIYELSGSHIITKYDTEIIARFNKEIRTEVESMVHKANTQPDLLEACELMVEYCEEQQIYDKLSKHGDFYYKAKAAIDKVKGGSK